MKAAAPRSPVLGRFHRDTGGQISFLMVMAAVLLTALIGMVAETGTLATRKVDLQNAADGAVLSGGVWVARGMNTVSGLNVIQTQLVGAAILINAMKTMCDYTHPVPFRLLKAAWKLGCTASYGICVPCCVFWGIMEVQDPILKGICKVIDKLSELSKCPDAAIWQVVKGLQKLKWVVRRTFVGAAILEAYNVGGDNGTDWAIFMPANLFYPDHLAKWKKQLGIGQADVLLELASLPVFEGERKEFCDAMERGTPKVDPPERGGYYHLIGYRDKCGWEKHIPGFIRKLLNLPKGFSDGCGPFRSGKNYLGYVNLATTGIPPIGFPIFEGAAYYQKYKVCGGQKPEAPSYEAPMSIEECMSLNLDAWWVHTTKTSAPQTKPPNGWDYWESELSGREGKENPDGNPEGGGARVKKSCNFKPKGYRKRGPGFFWRVRENKVSSGDENNPPTYTYTLDEWVITELPKKNQTVNVEDDGGKCKAPLPYILRSELLGEYNGGERQYFLIAKRSRRSLIFPESFIGNPPRDQLTFAQIEIYNAVSDDMFTQDWRVRLQRATVLERPIDAVTGSQIVQKLDQIYSKVAPDVPGISNIPFLRNPPSENLEDYFSQVFNH